MLIMDKTQNLRMAVFASLFTAFMIAGAYISFNIGGAPFVLSNLFILMAGTLLGLKWGAASVSIYILLGAAGLPVFTRGGGGIAYIIGPTGGFILGYLIAVVLTALISSRNKQSKNKAAVMIRDFSGMFCGLLAMYLTGVPWFVFIKEMSPAELFAVFGILFIFDIIKITVAVFIIRFLRPIIQNLNYEKRV
jgi:biotin transport system substrate-specific component